MERKNSTKQNRRRRKPLSPTHTKGYYRFAKDFPSVTDSDGFRDNDLFVNSPAKKASVRRGLLIVFVIFFVVAYCVTMLAFAVSNLPAAGNQVPLPDNFAPSVLNGYNSSHLSGEVLSYDSVESVISEFKTSGIDTVVIDFKDAEGFFYFVPSISVSTEALYRSSENAAKVVKEFKDAGITVFARVACFADDIYCRNNRDHAAHIMTTPESGSYSQVRTMWYNSGDDSHAWMNPYSNEVIYYLRTIITDVEDCGVNGIIFDYVSLPAESQRINVLFDGADSAVTPNAEMADFVTTINSVYLNCTTGVFVTTEYAASATEKGILPDCVNSGCDFIVVDSRPSSYPNDTVVGTKLFKVPANSPTEFVQQFITEFGKLINDDEELSGKEIIPVISKNGADEQKAGIEKAGAKSFIIYSK